MAPQGMHPADIVAAVKKKGTNLSRLALANGFGESTLRAALKKPHVRAQRVIAATIGRPVHEIWPQWFDAQGRRIAAGSRSRSPKVAGSAAGDASVFLTRKDAA